MAKFRAVLIEHSYPSSRYEHDIIAAAGGEFIDCRDRPVEAGVELCAQADGILLQRVEVTAEMIKGFARCKVIVRYGVGTDNVDVDAATEAGIIVANVPDYCIDEVSTHAVALLLCCVRDVVNTHAKMVDGAWDTHTPTPVSRVHGRTLGLVGFGQIGRAVARKLAPWGLRILATDPFVEPELAAARNVRLVDLPTLCAESDYISLHVPLLPETRHLIGAPQLGLLKPGAILVNTSRGPVVDTRALARALDDGRLARAALDVFEEEPLPANSPLRSHPRLVLTDHVAWYSEESRIELQTSAARAIVTVCTGGLPGSLANPAVIERLRRLDEWVPAECMRWQLKRAEQRSRHRG